MGDNKTPDKIYNIFEKASDVFANSGEEAVTRFLENSCINTQIQTVNIAVTGRVNAGKSTFINVILGTEKGAKNEAETSIVECTKEPEDYSNEKQKNVVYTDLPGIGTPSHPREKYVNAMKFGKFDAFLILSRDSFTEDDKWLADEIVKLGKPFFFVRTRLDEDISNNRRNGKSENETKQMVRANIEHNLNQLTGKQRIKVFLISNLDDRQHDFPQLVTAIKNSLDDIKQEAYTYGLKNISLEILNEKIKYLEAGAIKVALISGACAAIPFPGLSATLDMALIAKEFDFYNKQLCPAQYQMTMSSLKKGVEKISAECKHQTNQPDNSSSNLEKGAEKVSTECEGKNKVPDNLLSNIVKGVEKVVIEGLSGYNCVKIMDEIKERFYKTMPSITPEDVNASLNSLSSGRVRQNISEYIGLNVTEEFTRYLPVVGSVASGGFSFYTTRKILLDKIKELGDKQKEILRASNSENKSEHELRNEKVTS